MRFTLALTSLLYACGSGDGSSKDDAGSQSASDSSVGSDAAQSMDAATTAHADASGASDASLPVEDGGNTSPADAALGSPSTTPAQLAQLAYHALTWPPAGCNTEVASDLRSVAPLVWHAAGADAAGCETLSVQELGGYVASPHVAGGYEIIFDSENDSVRSTVVYGADGMPQLALRYDGSCDTEAPEQGDAPCWSCSVRGEISGGSTAVACGDPAAPSAEYSVAQVSGSLVVSDAQIAMTSSGTRTLSFDRSGAPGAARSADVAGNLYNLSIHGQTLAAVLETNQSGVWHRTLVRSENGGAYAVFREPNPRVVWTLAADTDALAWVETDSAEGYDLREGTLYVAPWPAPGTALAPRMVRIIDRVSRDQLFALKNGYFAHTAAGTVRVYRVSDGALWTVPVPSGLELGVDTRVWLDGTHVVYDAQGAASGEARPLVRCTLDAVTSRPQG